MAEKFQAMVVLGIANSRMKDFYDIWVLAQQFEFEGSTLCAALQATFHRRQTPLPAKPPLALTPEFGADRSKVTQWSAFLKKGNLAEQPQTLSEVLASLEAFLMPPTLALASPKTWPHRWSNGQWS